MLISIIPDAILISPLAKGRRDGIVHGMMLLRIAPRDVGPGLEVYSVPLGPNRRTGFYLHLVGGRRSNSENLDGSPSTSALIISGMQKMH